ncbi:hypothetical protein E4U50_004087 [Claviceps purpurea]|nr:hypothetical protein E4U50_004087 [Claviceps purpurea]KAG6218697.1 hypothetical protein E4U26_007545 [Claviceps purpurea]
MVKKMDMGHVVPVSRWRLAWLPPESKKRQCRAKRRLRSTEYKYSMKPDSYGCLFAAFGRTAYDKASHRRYANGARMEQELGGELDTTEDFDRNTDLSSYSSLGLFLE